MPDSKHLSHAIGIPGVLRSLVRHGHLTINQAEKMAAGFVHMNVEDTLFVVLAMGNGEGTSLRVEQLTEYDWRILRGLILKRRIKIEEVLGIQYVTTTEPPSKLVPYLRNLGLME